MKAPRLAPVAPVAPVPAVPKAPARAGDPLAAHTLPLSDNPISPDLMMLGPTAYPHTIAVLSKEMGLLYEEAIHLIEVLNSRVAILEPTWITPAIPILKVGDRLIIDHLALNKCWCRVMNPNATTAELSVMATAMVSTTRDNLRYNMYRLSKVMWPALTERLRTRALCNAMSRPEPYDPIKLDNLRAEHSSLSRSLYDAD